MVARGRVRVAFNHHAAGSIDGVVTITAADRMGTASAGENTVIPGAAQHSFAREPICVQRVAAVAAEHAGAGTGRQHRIGASASIHRVAGTCHDRVIAVTARNTIRIGTTIKRIRPGTPDQGVQPRIALQQVIADTAARIEQIIPGTTHQRVIAATETGEERIVARPAEHRIIATATGALEGVVAAIAEQRIVAGSTLQRIVTESAIYRITAVAAEHGIVAAACADRIRSASRIDRVGKRCPIDRFVTAGAEKVNACGREVFEVLGKIGGRQIGHRNTLQFQHRLKDTVRIRRNLHDNIAEAIIGNAQKTVAHRIAAGGEAMCRRRR